MLTEFFVLFAIAGYFFYKWLTANFNYFKERNIPHESPRDFLGTMKSSILGKKSMFDSIVDQYKKFDSKVYGLFEMRTPIVALKDPELIRQVTVKYFDHFVNHRSFVDEEHGGLFAKSLFVMKDQKWKDMRATLSPAFTGSKMRLMFELIREVSQQVVEYLKKDKRLTSDGMELDMKDLCTRITNDMIATTAFGIQVNSLTDPKNEFYTIGKTISTFTTWQNFKFILFLYGKWLVKIFNLKLFDEKYTNYFMRLVLGSMKYRADNNIFRPDMINMLMEAQGTFVGQKDEKNDKSNATGPQWTDEEIVGQCFAFFFAGFETSAVLMCLTAHEIMENPDVQRKLQDEIAEVKESLDGKPLNYESLQGMKYLDAVVSETLRKWPPAAIVDRVCSKTFQLKDHDLDLEIPVGQAVFLPIAGIHRDPQYYPDPDKFDPERFSDENKSKILPFTYLPFGVGPRNCIGSRFVLMEVKAILYHLLSEFNFEAAEKSTIPLRLKNQGFQLTPPHGFWLKLVAREN